MIDLKSFLKLKPEDLAQEQYEVLKEFTINKLKTVIKLIEDDELDKVYDYTANSPAGDGYGKDNHYIDFSDCGVFDIEDIEDILDRLTQLDKIIDPR